MHWRNFAKNSTFFCVSLFTICSNLGSTFFLGITALLVILNCSSGRGGKSGKLFGLALFLSPWTKQAGNYSIFIQFILWLIQTQPNERCRIFRKKFLFCLFSNFFGICPFSTVFFKKVVFFCLKLRIVVGTKHTKNIFKKKWKFWVFLDAFVSRWLYQKLQIWKNYDSWNRRPWWKK